MVDAKKPEEPKKVPSLAEATQKKEEAASETTTPKTEDSKNEVERFKKEEEKVEEVDSATEDSEGRRVVNNITPQIVGDKFEEVGEDHVDLPGQRDGMWLGEAPKHIARKRQEWEASGFVHQWEENPQENLAFRYEGEKSGSALPDGVHPHQKRDNTNKNV